MAQPDDHQLYDSGRRVGIASEETLSWCYEKIAVFNQRIVVSAFLLRSRGSTFRPHLLTDLSCKTLFILDMQEGQ